MQTIARAPRGSVRVVRLAAIALVALALTVSLAVPASARHHTMNGGKHASSQTLTQKQLAFHDGMRKLWEDHVTWTRLAIVSFAAGLPDFDATAQRLLRNQADIGNAIKPYYGSRAGAQLTSLLRVHILTAVDVLKAAKAGDAAALGTTKRDWYANGDDIARFLSRANPRSWPFSVVRSMMRMHLDQTLAEAVARLNGNAAADIAAYDEVHRHILVMADALSGGIMKQFPNRFR